ncbi:AmpE protein [Salmonella enterica subsp. indica]|uniref:AmpE protein n=1 Tax=Salmonella enterica subsp. indica TaxID=59207 RepID=A0A379XUA8_SALER|nr:AmpE protein [Salmonella enterica subsp. indica]
MTLFTTLLVLIVERLFKLGEHWQLDHRLEALFRRITHFSMLRTMGMTAIAMGGTFLLLQALKGLLFNVPTLVVWILLGRTVYRRGQSASTLSRLAESGDS